VIVAVPFACVRPDSVSMRGVVFCPQIEPGFLLSRLGDGGKQTGDDAPAAKRKSSRNWIKKHFDRVDPPSPRVQFAPLALKRDFAFARITNVAVGSSRLVVRFDVFVGPGVYPLPGNDGNKAGASARAIHGFADITHHPVFDSEVAHGKGGPVPGHAALCLVEKPGDLLGDGWRLRREGILQVVTQDEIGAMLLVEPTRHWHQRGKRVSPDAVVRDEIGNPLERGLILRARLIVKLSEVRDRQVVGL